MRPIAWIQIAAFTFLFGSSSVALGQNDSLPKLAVIPLEGRGLDPNVLAIFEELLVNEVHRYRRYTVIGANDIEALLGLERMKDALGCSDVACAVELGGALGAKYLLAGSVIRLADTVIVSLRIVDVPKQEVAARAQVKIDNHEKFYAGSIEAAVNELMGTGQVTAPPSRQSGIERVIANKSGDLWLSSMPTGAVISVDGKERGVTPARVADLLPGRHRVAFRLQGYLPASGFVEVQPGKTVSVDQKLTLLAGTLLIESVPPGEHAKR